ncbi:MAG: helix-turn-helix transcriptional regulator [Phycisphaerae bacterium]|jgi:ribosome-binding protein aMBF1 (putative translation factor)
MSIKIVELSGQRWAIMSEKEYKRLAARAGEAGPWPELPKAGAKGEYPAVEYARASLARKIIKSRRAAGLSQADLARRAGIRPETLNRLEKGKTTPDVATIAKIERALEKSEETADAGGGVPRNTGWRSVHRAAAK